MTLHLVRHAMPFIDPQVLPADWQLHPERTEEVRALAASGYLPRSPDTRWCTSPEPKSIATATLLTRCLGIEVGVETVDDLREQHRPAGWIEEFAVRNHRALVSENTPSAPGWETASSTRRRVVAAVRTLLADPAREVVLIGHGTAWLLLVSELTSRPVDLMAWERLGLPDHCALREDRVVVPWGAWRSGA